MKKVIEILTILLLIILSMTMQPIIAEPSVEEKSLSILSNVFNIDLSRYQIIHNGTSNDYTSAFGQNGKQVVVDYTLISGENKLFANLVFVNGNLWFCNLDTVSGNPIYTQSTQNSTIDKSKATISKYQAYSLQYNIQQVPEISSMATILKSVYELKNVTIAEENIKLNMISKYDQYYNLSKQTITWFFTENNYDVTKKAITLEFLNGNLVSISDTWNLFSIGSFNYISKEEALSLAWNAAQNCTLKFVSDNNTIFEIKPDLKNANIETYFSMEPRNPNVLYPFWQIRYYFSKAYYSDYGIQVGIWGDTQKVAYCESLTHLGGVNPTPTIQTIITPTGNTIPLSVIILVSLMIAITTFVAVRFKRRLNK
jgi:hypothetical protein